MTVLTQGFFICLLDDVTSQYEEPLLQIVFKDLDFTQSSLQSNDAAGLNLVEAGEEYASICQVMKNSGLLSERNLWLLKRKIEIFMYASYFNHKSHGEEMLIEQYRIQLSMT